MAFEIATCRECGTEYPATNTHRRGCKTALRERKAAAARLEAVTAAVNDEAARFNRAIAAGVVVMLPTFNGAYRVEYVDSNFWYHTDGNGGFGQSWAGCNDGTWANLLSAAGVPRNPAAEPAVRRQ